MCIMFIYYNEEKKQFRITTLENDKELAYLEKGYKQVGTVNELFFENMLNLNTEKREKEINELKIEFK